VANPTSEEEIKRRFNQMNKRIIIPVEDEAGLNARLAQHFGRAPYFAVVEMNQNGQVLVVKTEKNTSEHMGGVGHPHDTLLALKPDVIVAYAMGPGGLNSFHDAGVIVLKATGNTVKEIIDSYNERRMKELEGGCEHAHHHTH
jgi:predicted Fe-Mo cluster-binding NifX family protein